jgi:hypothetical protein
LLNIIQLIFKESVGEILPIINEGIINIAKQRNKTPRFNKIIVVKFKSKGTSET